MIEIIATVVTILALTFSIYQFNRNRSLQKELFEYQKAKDYKEEIIKKIKRTLLGKTQQEERRVYLDHIYSKFKYLDFTGLNAILQRPLKLEKIYIKLRIVQTREIKQYKSISDFNSIPKKKESEEAQDFLESLISIISSKLKIRDPIKVLIMGNPGSGKTTLMKWISLQCSSKELNYLSDYIPIFIPLKDFGKFPNETYKQHNLRDICLTQCKKENLSTGFLRKAIGSEKMIFLLDGLDEVAKESTRREVIDWIQKQNISRSIMIITSRFSGLRPSKGLVFNEIVDVCEIQDFNIDDIKKFLNNWYANIEMAVLSDDDKNDSIDFLTKSRSRFEDLMRVMHDENFKSIRDLSVNPLLLTIIAIVHRTRAVLPRERHKLYEEAVKVMIELWNIANRKIELSFSVDNAIANLSIIAVYLMKKNSRELSMSTLIKILPSSIEGKPRSSFINEMILKSGLIYQSEGKLGFLHLTFQEYLTARSFARSRDQNEILSYISKDYWTETFRLFVNIGNTRLFIEAVIDSLKYKSVSKLPPIVVDLIDEIVIEDEKNYYKKELFAYMLRPVLRLKSNLKDNNKAYGIYESGFFREYINKVDFSEWEKFILTEKNFYVTNMVTISILENDSIDNINLYLMLRNKIELYSVKLLQTKSESKHNSTVNNFIISCYLSFYILSIYSRDLENFIFIVKFLKSKVDVVRFLAIIVLKDNEIMKNIVSQLELDYLYILKSATELTHIQSFDNPEDNKGKKQYSEVKPIRMIITPKNYKEIAKKDYSNICLDLRPIYQYDDLISEFYEKKTSLQGMSDELSRCCLSFLNNISQLSSDKIMEYFPNSNQQNIPKILEKINQYLGN